VFDLEIEVLLVPFVYEEESSFLTYLFRFRYLPSGTIFSPINSPRSFYHKTLYLSCFLTSAVYRKYVPILNGIARKIFA
jgi:hypothetical protein